MQRGALTPAGAGGVSKAGGVRDNGTDTSTDTHRLAQAAALLRHSGLPARWAGRERFVVLQAGFGCGDVFLAAWQAWRQDPARCRRLVFVAIERQAPTLPALRLAHGAQQQPAGRAALAADLLAAWPPATANLHRLAFDGGSVQLLLGWGDVPPSLGALQLQADAIVLDTAALASDARPPDARLLKAFGRRAAADATLAALTPAVTAPWLCAALAAAGFDVVHSDGSDAGGTAAIVAGSYRPRATAARADAGAAVAATGRRRAVVIGAGLAGAFTASALADEGWTVTVLDRHALPAQETSGQAGGVFHGTLHAGDGRHARLLRAAALQAERTLRPLIDGGAVPGQLRGLLRLETRGLDAMQQLIAAQRQPPDWVQAADRAAASALAGVALPTDAWFYPGGGWVAPAALVAQLLAGSGIRFAGGQHVQSLRAVGAGWQALSADARVLAEADVAVLASGAALQRLLEPTPLLAPLQRLRGQSSGWQGAPGGLLLPLAGNGYALPLPGGGVLCGASSSEDDADSDMGSPIDSELGDRGALRHADHLANFERLQQLTGLRPPADTGRWTGRVGWRLQTDDRLPMAGAVPLQPPAGSRRRLDQPRLWPRVPGLYVCGALGGRGITLAPLLGRLLAAQIAGSPWPLERALADAVDPARWLVRSVRRDGG